VDAPRVDAPSVYNASQIMKKIIQITLLLCLHFGGFSQKNLVWDFPLPRTHTGVLMGNGTQGLMIWGEANVLKITIGRAGFWDRRGGNPFTAKATFQDVKKLLEAKDDKAMKELFAVPKNEGSPNLGHPQQMGGGRLEITFPEGWKLLRGDLDLQKAELKIVLKNPSGKEEIATILQASNDEIAWVNLPKNCQVVCQLIPSWNYVQKQLEAVGIQAPVVSTIGDATKNLGQSFTQTLPADESLTIDWNRKNDNNILITSTLGKSTSKNTDLLQLKSQRDIYWKKYWETVPKINLPDKNLQEIIDYGLYKQASVTPPQGVAAALEGCFNEEYQLPPWSNDYHFNINIEMIYTPALASNRAEHLMPLWKMMASWMPTLQTNGEKFFGRKGALMLPHAVDDHCQVVGTFWTGTIDHACTAWMAYLAWQHYRYTMDKEVLDKTAWTLLEGAFEGYWAMLEEVEDGKGGKRFSLPISVSPEYRGDRMDAWGRDASFQLAALHRIAKILPEAAKILNKPIDPRWADVDKRLPQFTTFEGVYMDEWKLSNKRIALWQGQDLIESHRHHSHLASIFPFATINPQSTDYQSIVSNSISAWTYRGAGGWSGWCVPWASTLLSRVNNPDGAVSWLHYWKDNFTNEGRGTLHNAAFKGQSLISDGGWFKEKDEKKNREIMQLDAGFGAMTAIYELLVQNREDVIYVLPAIHRDWKNFDFENIGAEGAFQISAKVKEGKIQEIKVKSLAGGTLKLAHNLGEDFLLNGQATKGNILEKQCIIGEEILLKRK
jgi:alpha-L-fucosidase 2